ncbi:hypothetical protein [Paraglaciecola aestuariivivens]
MNPLHADAKFMFRMGIALFVMSILAFSPRYFLPLFTAELNIPSMWLHAHASFSMLWLAIFIFQSWLITQNNRAWHRKLGLFALLIAIGNVLSGLFLQLDTLPAASEQAAVGPAFRLFQSIPTFVLFLVLALAYRRRADFHLRFMYQTAFAGITSIADRLLTFYSPLEQQIVGPMAGLTGLLCMLALPIYDKLVHKNVHKASWIGLLVYFIFQFSIAGFVFQADWWLTFAVLNYG